MKEINQKKSLKTALDRYDKIVTSINGALLVAALTVMFLLIFVNVIGRYFFSKTIMGADELARYLMISGCFLGIGMAMRRSQHSSFTIVQDVLPSKLRIALRAFVSLIIFAAIFSLMILGWQYAMKYVGNKTEMLRMPVTVWYMTIPLGCVLFVHHFLFCLKDYVFMAKNADIDAEIAAGEALTSQSEFMNNGAESADK